MALTSDQIKYEHRKGKRFPHVICILRPDHLKYYDHDAPPKGWKYFAGRGWQIDTDVHFWLVENIGEGNYTFEVKTIHDDFTNTFWPAFEVAFKTKDHAMLYRLVWT